jgi:phosphatidate cytidylyltransferase
MIYDKLLPHMDSVNVASGHFRKLLTSNLFQRIGSAAVLLPIVAFVVWWGEPLVSAVVILVAAMALHELYALFQAGGYMPRHRAGYLSLLLFVLAAAFEARTAISWTGAALAAGIVITLGFEVMHRDRQQQLVNWALTLSGAVYIGWSLAHFVLLRDIDQPLDSQLLNSLRFDTGAMWIIAVLAITFANDTTAYFIGRTFGQHRMAPYLSPKKSWEGAIGGMAGAMLAGAALIPLLGLPGGVWAGALVGAVGSIAGQLGDLAESLIKRQVGIKDSGRIIPGHGGLLDRVDSLLFTAPVLYYLAYLLTH